MSEMYKYDYLVDRKLQYSLLWNDLLEKLNLDVYAMDNHGNGFENEIFAIRPYNWNDENDELANFEYKPKEFSIEWYKYPFRASYMNQDLSIDDIDLIFFKCLLSLYQTGFIGGKMPVTENGIEYTIPNYYKQMITKSFLQTLKYELKIVFSKNLVIEDFLFNNEEDWINLSSTGGWGTAFRDAAKLHKLEDLVLYYNSLPWYDSDMFDSDIIDLALLYNVIDPMIMPTFSQILRERIHYQWLLRDYYFTLIIDWIKALFKKKQKNSEEDSGWTIDDE